MPVQVIAAYHAHGSEPPQSDRDDDADDRDDGEGERQVAELLEKDGLTGPGASSRMPVAAASPSPARMRWITTSTTTPSGRRGRATSSGCGVGHADAGLGALVGVIAGDCTRRRPRPRARPTLRRPSWLRSAGGPHADPRPVPRPRRRTWSRTRPGRRGSVALRRWAQSQRLCAGFPVGPGRCPRPARDGDPPPRRDARQRGAAVRRGVLGDADGRRTILLGALGVLVATGLLGLVVTSGPAFVISRLAGGCGRQRRPRRSRSPSSP